MTSQGVRWAECGSWGERDRGREVGGGGGRRARAEGGEMGGEGGERKRRCGNRG